MAGQDRERPGPETQRPGLHPPVPKTHTPSTLQAPAEKSQNLRASMATVLDEGTARQVPEPQRHEEGPMPFTAATQTHKCQQTKPSSVLRRRQHAQVGSAPGTQGWLNMRQSVSRTQHDRRIIS